MNDGSMDRVQRALSGSVVAPPVAGMTFIDPALLSDRITGSPPAMALARACAGLHLDFAFVPSWEPWAAEAVQELHAVGVAALWVVPGVLGTALEATGFEEGLRMSIRDPERLAEAMDVALAGAMGEATSGVGARAQALVVADDMAGAAGPLLSGRWLATEVFPRLTCIAALAGDAGLPAVLHCDGAAETVYADVHTAGFVGVHGDCGGPGRVAVALDAARRAGIGLIGGLSASELTGPDRAGAAAARAVFLARGGGLLIADDGGVSTPEGCAALIAALAAVRLPV